MFKKLIIIGLFLMLPIECPVEGKKIINVDSPIYESKEKL